MHHLTLHNGPSSRLVASDVLTDFSSLTTNQLFGLQKTLQWCISWIRIRCASKCSWKMFILSVIVRCSGNNAELSKISTMSLLFTSIIRKVAIVVHPPKQRGNSRMSSSICRILRISQLAYNSSNYFRCMIESSLVCSYLFLWNVRDI